MARKLTVVTAETVPEPASIKEAVDRSERALLVAMRKECAAVLDAKPPAHAVAQLMRQLRDLDKEIRLLDAREAEEVSRGAHVEDSKFDASAI